MKRPDGIRIKRLEKFEGVYLLQLSQLFEEVFDDGG